MLHEEMILFYLTKLRGNVILDSHKHCSASFSPQQQIGLRHHLTKLFIQMKLDTVTYMHMVTKSTL